MNIGPESQLVGQLVSDIASATKNIYPTFQSMQIMRKICEYPKHKMWKGSGTHPPLASSSL